MKSEWQLSCNVFRSVSELALRFRVGSDTSAALHWMRAKGANPLPTRPTWGSLTNRTTTTFHARHAKDGAEKARLIDCRAQLVTEGLAALQCGAFHISTAGVTYFNTTHRSRRHRDDARSRDERR